MNDILIIHLWILTNIFFYLSLCKGSIGVIQILFLFPGQVILIKHEYGLNSNARDSDNQRQYNYDSMNNLAPVHRRICKQQLTGTRMITLGSNATVR